MRSGVTILTLRELDTADVNLIKLIDFCGVKCNVINWSYSEVSIDYLKKHISRDDPCLMINSRFYADIFPNEKYADDFRSFLFSKLPYVMVYNLFPNNLQNLAIKHLSNNAFQSLSYIENSNYEYQITDEAKDICKQFSSLSFETSNKHVDFTLNTGNQYKDVFSLISINKLAFFVKLKIENCNLFILANNKVLDIDSNIPESFNLKECFSQFIPLMMFIKYVFKGKCWHNNTTRACLTVDDPLLKKKYGYIDYFKLINQMDKHNFSTSIAFIPWNYKRTDKKVANLFKTRTDRFSLCVHGCEHSKGEFGEIDKNIINNKIKLAAKRMKLHEDEYALNFDKIMIFPKGKFSTASMQMLKSNNFLAAVNSEAFPIDKAKNLKISHFLKPAIMEYENFPLFFRRYPRELLDFAFDMFLGKALLVVTHHMNFKQGANHIIKFINRINSLDKKIQWSRLEDVLENTYLQQYEDSDMINVQLFTKTVIIKNIHNQKKTYNIFKYETNNIPIKNVLLNGKRIDYKIEKDNLRLILEIKPKEKAVLDIIYKDKFPYYSGKKNKREKIKIFIRRHLSEIRDNYVNKNQFLNNLLIKYKK